jgi:hypothetical protein
MSNLILLIENLSKLGINKDIVNFMAENTNNATQLENHATTVQIKYNDGVAEARGNSVRSIFIYTTGALRLSLLRGAGTLASRAFVIGSTLATFAGAKFLHNAINDPKYVKSHMENWRILWNKNNPSPKRSGGTVEVHVNADLETKSMVETITNSPSVGNNENNNISGLNNLLIDSNSLDELSNKIINSILDYLSPILTPVKVGYSNELLADQLNYIS